jgi:hypothetical protein
MVGSRASYDNKQQQQQLRRGKRGRGIGLTDASVGREEEEKKGLFFLLARAGLSSYLCSP